MEIRPQEITFRDYPKFKPNLTPRQIFQLGSFIDQGGYWRPIFSSVVGKHLQDCHLEFKPYLLEGIDDALLINPDKNPRMNRYGVKCGSSLSDWEKHNWISKHDPYGWLQWYCRFYCRNFFPSYNNNFKTSEETDTEDTRQIERWVHFTGKKGRWKRYLLNLIVKKQAMFDDETVSPITRQNLQHWGYQITESDLGEFMKEIGKR